MALIPSNGTKITTILKIRRYYIGIFLSLKYAKNGNLGSGVQISIFDLTLI